MTPYDEPIYEFLGERVSTRGYINLHTMFREGNQKKKIHVRPSLNTQGAVVSTPHLAMKFP